MKRILIFCIIFAFALASLTADAAVPVFLDVPEKHWAYRSVYKAYEDGVVNGTFSDPAAGVRYFSPDSAITTAEFLTMLGRAFFAADMTLQGGESWYRPAERLDRRYSLLSESARSSSMLLPLNRYEMAAIICNVLKHFQVELPTVGALTAERARIGDYQQIAGQELRRNVEIVFSMGILTGIDERGTFAGQNSTTRAETTVIYHRLAKLLSSKTGSEISLEDGSDLIPAGIYQPEKTAAVSEAEFSSEIVRLINIERESRGLSPLSEHAQLTVQAQIRSKEVTAAFSHTRPNGKSAFSLVKEAGIAYSWIGENIAAGYPTPQEAVKSWMNSEGHRANILAPNANRIGVGYTRTEDGYQYYWTQFLAEIK